MKKVWLGTLACSQELISALPVNVRTRKTLIGAAVLALLVVLCGGLLLFGASKSKDDPRAKMSVLERIEANGKTEGAQKEVAMRPEIPGKLAVLYVRENQDVSQGTLLAELDNETQKQQLNLAKA